MKPTMLLLLGIGCAGIGGELFVRGLVGIARWARISAGLIGSTVAAFATSSPEVSVAVSAALSGRPEISLGDALGSNVVNIALILGLALCVAAIPSPRASVRRDFPTALLVPVVIAALGYDGVLSRTDGIVLLAVFLIWVGLVIQAARRERAASKPKAEKPQKWSTLGQCMVGFLFLIGSGYFIVQGARGIASIFEIPEFVIGATLVAIGTSMPELATTIISKWKGQDEIGLGTVLGSNVFNGLFIIGLAATIAPIQVMFAQVGWALAVGLIATTLTLPMRNGLIPRARGFYLLALYLIFVVVALQR